MEGSGEGSSVSFAGIWGYYWSSTYSDYRTAYPMFFNSGSVYPRYSSYGGDLGFAVRCVKDY